MKIIGILGSTGSIGTQTLDVVRANRGYSGNGHGGRKQYQICWRSRSGSLSRPLAAVWDEEKAKELALRVGGPAR